LIEIILFVASSEVREKIIKTFHHEKIWMRKAVKGLEGEAGVFVGIKSIF